MTSSREEFREEFSLDGCRRIADSFQVKHVNVVCLLIHSVTTSRSSSSSNSCTMYRMTMIEESRRVFRTALLVHVVGLTVVSTVEPLVAHNLEA